MVNGMVIRCVLPEMSGERRQELSKVANGMAESGRVRVREIRHVAIEHLKKAKKDGLIGEDDLKRLEKEVQRITDAAVKEIDDSLHLKSSDLARM
jgi:ribosome recycling factor